MPHIRAKDIFTTVPVAVLEKIGTTDLLKLTKHAMEYKNYEALKAIINVYIKHILKPYQTLDPIIYKAEITYALKPLMSSILLYADLEAIRVLNDPILPHYKNILLAEISYTAFGALESSSISYKDYCKFRIDAIKIVAEQMVKFTTEDLGIISYYLPESDFNQLINSKSINLDDESYKTLQIEAHTLTTNPPLLGSINNNSPIIDSLLTRTYSEDKNLEQIRKVYENLLASQDKTILKVMQYTAMTIIEGANDLKIFFGANTTSSYNPMKNTIIVETDIETEFNTLELIFMHELGHHFFNQLYAQNSLPFILKNTDKINSQYSNDAGAPALEAAQSRQEALGLFINHSQQIGYIQHQKAELAFVVAAGKILGCHESSEGLNMSDEPFLDDSAINFAKLVCPEVSLISEVIGNGFLEQTKPSSKSKAPANEDLADRVFSLWKLYEKCTNGNSDKNSHPSAEITIEEIEQKVKNECLPQTISQNHLDKDDIFFLARVSDWVKRGDKIFYGNYTYYDFDNERSVELVVRLPEMVAAGLKEEIIQMMQPIADFWHQFVLPEVTQLLAEYESKCGLDSELPCLGVDNFLSEDEF